ATNAPGRTGGVGARAALVSPAGRPLPHPSRPHHSREHSMTTTSIRVAATAPATTSSTTSAATVIPAVDYPAAVRSGALVVDIRSRAQRERQGVLAGAVAVEARPVVDLLDPRSAAPLASVVEGRS